MQEKIYKELYKEFLLGNNKSFEEIVKRHKNSIIYFIQRYTKSIDIAEDIAQDVFLYVLIHKKNYRFEYSLKTYLYTIAKSKALNYIKREKRIVTFSINSSSGLKTNSRAVIYKIDLENGFSLQGEIGTISNNYEEEVRRIVFVNGNYYTLSYSQVRVADMDSLNVFKVIDI